MIYGDSGESKLRAFDYNYKAEDYANKLQDFLHFINELPGDVCENISPSLADAAEFKIRSKTILLRR